MKRRGLERARRKACVCDGQPYNWTLFELHLLPWGFIGTAEMIYDRDVNGIYYINANLPVAQASFVGPDTRPRWTSNRINPSVTTADPTTSATRPATAPEIAPSSEG